MSLWSRIQSSLSAMVRRSQMEGEMDAELRFHLEAYAEDLVRNGVPREQAMRRARIEFGGVERVKEECREARGVGTLETFWLDMRYGLRTLRKNPGFAAATILVFALGISSAVAIFAFVDSALLEPLPYANPNRLMSVMESNSTFSPLAALVCGFPGLAKNEQILQFAGYFQWEGLSAARAVRGGIGPGVARQ